MKLAILLGYFREQTHFCIEPNKQENSVTIGSSVPPKQQHLGKKFVWIVGALAVPKYRLNQRCR
jgi:fructose-specific component phosphotransferase system IIB-like protein